MRNVPENVVQKIKTHIMFSIKFFQTLCCLCEIVEKIGRARGGTDGNITRFMCLAYWMSTAVNTQSEYSPYLVKKKSTPDYLLKRELAHFLKKGGDMQCYLLSESDRG